MQKTRPKLWTKDFIVISSVNFLITLIFFLLMVTISIYAVDIFEASTSQAGLVTGIFIIGTLMGRLFTGRVIDSVGRKRVMIVGLALFTLTTAQYFITIDITFLLVNRFINGIALGVASTATGTIVAQIIPNRRKGEGIGYYSMSGTLAMAIGPFLGLFMSQFTTFNVIFTFCLVLCLLTLVTSIFINVPALDGPASTVREKGIKITQFLEPKVLPIASVILVFAFAYSSVLSFITIYAIEINLVSAASFFFLVYALSILVSRPFTGRLMDVKGANLIMYPAFVSFAVGLLLLSTAESSILLLIAAVLIGLGIGNMQSTTQAIALKLTAPHRLGLATSTYFLAFDAGLGFGPYVLGLMITQMGFSKVYISLALLMLFTSVLYYFMHGRKERNEMREINE
ncbi:MFS transporter [Sporosarcina sp. FA9]|uniref:MFS transporter n=1 Tax=Sporosarcina sp. FA9 TaxID=3413030 RepID=UPI003F6599BE